jgi:hypothetical protein
MTARITAARARQLGLPGVEPTTPRGKRRTTRKTVPSKECGPTFCVTCDETFPRPVDEDRHFAAHRDHRRYGCVLEAVS